MVHTSFPHFSVTISMSPSFHISFFVFIIFFLFFFLSVSVHTCHLDNDGDSDSDGSRDATPDLQAKPLIIEKVWCLIVTSFRRLHPVFGVYPYVLKWNKEFLVLGTQFAGGMFLGLAMMHFLNDANETFQDLTKKEYPFAFV